MTSRIGEAETARGHNCLVDELLALGRLQRSYEARAVAADHDPGWTADDDRALSEDWAKICDEQARLAPIIPTLSPAWLAACKAALEALPDQLEAAVAYYEWPSRLAEAVRILTLHHALPPLL